MRILIVDDEANIRDALAKLLVKPGRVISLAADGVEAQELLSKQGFDVVISDLRMPGMDGMALLDWVMGPGPQVPLIMMSAHGEIRDAVTAMKRGARDYVVKPFDPDELELRMVQAVEDHGFKKRMQAVVQPGEQPAKDLAPGSPMEALLAKVAKAAPTSALILIEGESGTGKEVMARRIHAMSSVASGPFVGINLGAVPEQLLESELFGHEKGAFTGADKRKLGMFEVASGGTLFLDEVGEMPLGLQVKLLRVLQERTIQRLGSTTSLAMDARIIAATHRNLQEEVRAGRFREDLYYRLKVVPLYLPPLRERLADLPMLCGDLLENLGRRMGKKNLHLTSQALRGLGRYSFPGNIRELENILERAIIFAQGEALDLADLELPLAPDDAPEPMDQGMDQSTQEFGLKTLAELEREAIEITLARVGGNQTRAAQILGISRRTLFSKIQGFGSF